MILVIIALNMIKYIGTYLTKEVQKLCNENYKTLVN